MNDNNINDPISDMMETDITHNDMIYVLPEGDVTVITQEAIIFDNQTAIVRKRKKNNEKKNTIACFSPKEIGFENYLKEIYF